MRGLGLYYGIMEGQRVQTWGGTSLRSHTLRHERAKKGYSRYILKAVAREERAEVGCFRLCSYVYVYIYIYIYTLHT